MPTGYTAKLYEGKEQTFEEFVLQCARGMGALVMMRDDPWDAPIPDSFEPSHYNSERVAEARERLRVAQAWSRGEARAAASAAAEREREAYEKRRQERFALRKRYEAMLEQVDAWDPPTPDHAALKELMREQLVGSIDFDCKDYSDAPEAMTGKEYRKHVIERAERDIDYHEKEQREEERRARERTEWVRELKESLGLAVMA